VLALNYAFIPMGVLGDTHRFGLSYYFAGKQVESTGASQILDEVPLAPVASQLDMSRGVVEKAEFDLGGLTSDVKADLAEWSMDITDPTTGAVLRTYKGKGEPPAKIAWDGKDDLGGVVAGGAFANFTLRLQTMEGKEIVDTHSVAAPDQLEQMRQMELRAKARAEAQAAAPKLELADVKPDRRGVIRIPPILFDTGSSALRRQFEPILELVGKVILENPGCKVYIEGHTDSEGASAVAFQLSRERSNAVLRYLVEKMGVQVNSITARGHGSTSPRAMGRTEDDKTANRRVEVLIIRPKR
jgi:outer membrane protein OmpA-like peptidoglycan-associated protein